MITRDKIMQLYENHITRSCNPMWSCIFSQLMAILMRKWSTTLFRLAYLHGMSSWIFSMVKPNKNHPPLQFLIFVFGPIHNSTPVNAPVPRWPGWHEADAKLVLPGAAPGAESGRFQPRISSLQKKNRPLRTIFLAWLDWFKGKSTGNHGFYHQI